MMESPIEVTCPSGHRLKANLKLQGKKVRCPKCQAVVAIPVLQRERENEVVEIVEATPVNPFGQTAETGFGTDNHDPFGLSDLPSLEPQTFSHLHGSTPYLPPVRSASVPKSKETDKSWFAKNIVALAVAGGVSVICLLVVVVVAITMFFGSSKRAQELAGSSPAPTNAVKDASAKPAKLEASPASSKTLALPPTVFAPAHTEGLMECPMLQEEVTAHVRRIHDLPDDLLESVLDVRAHAMFIRENGHSSFMLISPEEVKHLTAGEISSETAEKVKLLEAGLDKIDIYKMQVHFCGRHNLPRCHRSEFSSTAVGERAYAERLAVEWRQLLVDFAFSEVVDKASVAMIREVEDKCFGEDSIFQTYKNRLNERRAEQGRLNRNFARVAKAMFEYEAKYAQLPNDSGMPAFKDGGLSWRVALLPFLGHQDLYNRFHLNEPWDSEHNKSLIAEIPEEFVTHTLRFRGYGANEKHLKEFFGKTPPEQRHGLTSIHLISTPGTIFASDQRRTTDVEQKNQKCLFVAAGKERLVAWTKPGSLKPADNDNFAAETYFGQYAVFCSFEGIGRCLTHNGSSMMVRLSKAKGAFPDGDIERNCPTLGADELTLVSDFYKIRRKLRSRLIAIERKK